MAVKEDEKIIITSWDSAIEVYIGRGDTQMFEIVQNGVYPLLALKILKKDGSDVTTIASATITMRKQKGGAVKINAQTVAVTGTGPNLAYTFKTSETDEAAVFKARVTLTHNTGGSPVEPIPEVIQVTIKKAF